jgi:hypothetical protein
LPSRCCPQHLSSNPEIRARFEREAKTVSSLNHPHICTLYDVGREGDTDYLVMELIEGETLAARLTKGALPLAEVLKVGTQIADALDRAHRAGVMHRDLKPANVMLTRSGAKLMDFGLARATGLSGISELTNSPTVAGPLTAEGTILGTFQYMAPEQLEGKTRTPARTCGRWAACSMRWVTGRRAFEGKSQASLIAAVMHTSPAPVSQISSMTPPALDSLVSACLVKDPADRIQSAHDVKLQLSWIAAGGSQTGASAPAADASLEAEPRSLGCRRVGSHRRGRLIVHRAILAEGCPRPGSCVLVSVRGNALRRLLVEYRAVAGRAYRRLLRRGSRGKLDLDPSVELRDGAVSPGHARHRRTVVLVRQSYRRLLPPGKAQEGHDRRRTFDDALQRKGRARRHLEPRRGHPVRARNGRAARAHQLRKRGADAGDHARYQPARDGAPIPVVPSRRRPLPLRDASPRTERLGHVRRLPEVEVG